MATNIKVSLVLTAIAIFCFTQSNAQAKKGVANIQAKNDTLKVSEYAKIVYSPDNNRARLLDETKTQSGIDVKRKVVLFAPPSGPQIPSSPQPSYHAPTAQTVLVGAPGKQYYYNGDTGMSYKKKD